MRVLYANIIQYLSLFLAVIGQILLAIRYRKMHGDPRSSEIRDGGALRVLFIHRDLAFHGGVPKCLLYLARASDHARIDFRVGSFKDPSERMIESFGELQIKPICLGDGGYRNPSRKLNREIRDQSIDIVVATTFKAYLCAKYAVRGTDVRVIFWMHAVRGTIEGKTRRAIHSFLCRRDPMMFVSEAVRSAQRPAGHMGREAVIYNGVEDVADDPNYTPYGQEMRGSLGLPPDGTVLAYIAEFVDWKDHKTAIGAVHELVRRGENIHLLLIGTGELFEQTRAIAANGPAKDRIHFLGARSDARRILGLVDIYIHPSRGEGFGLAVVEAMLASRPVVAARDGAFVEYIRPGDTGLLFEPGDSKKLADAISELIRDRDLAIAIGKSAREFCLEKFDIERFADEIVQFIEDSNPGVMRRRRQRMNADRPRFSPDIDAEAAGTAG